MKGVCYLVSALFLQICYCEIMKKLSLYIFLVLMFCNVGFAESYVCKDDDNTTNKVETSIWERYSKDQFALRIINDDQKIYFDIYHEDQNAIILIAIAPDTKGIASLILNKNDLTYGGAQIFHPFDNYEIGDFTSGKCDKIN